MNLTNHKAVMFVCILGLSTSTGCLSELGLFSDSENQGDTSGSELEQAQLQLMENEAKLKATEEQLQAANEALGTMKAQLDTEARPEVAADPTEDTLAKDEPAKPKSSKKKPSKTSSPSNQGAQATPTPNTSSSSQTPTTETAATAPQPTNLRPPSGVPSLLGGASRPTAAAASPSGADSANTPSRGGTQPTTSTPAASASQPAGSGAAATNTPATTATAPAQTPTAATPTPAAPATATPATATPAATPSAETPTNPTPPKRRTNLFGKSNLLKSGGNSGGNRRGRTSQTPSRPSGN